MKKIFASKMFDIIAIAGIVMAYVYLTVSVADTDAFFIVSQGRDIIHDGIPYSLTRFPYFQIDTVIQNYGWCALVAFMYDLCGNAGIAIIQCIIVVSLGLAGAYLMKLKGSEKEYTKRVLIAVLAAGASMVSIRPQLMTLLLLMLEIIVIEKCIEKNDYRYSFLIIPIVIVEMQVHMAMWIMHFVVALPYIFPFRFSFVPLTAKYKYKKIKLSPTEKKNIIIGLIAGALSFGGLFINPYGAEGVSYFFKSVGYVEKFNISECSPLQFVFYIGIVLVFAIIMFVRKIEAFSSSDYYLISGIMLMTMVAVRNSSMLPIVLLILFSKYKKGEESELYIIFMALMVALPFIKMDYVPLTGELYNPGYEDIDNILVDIPDKHSRIFTQGYGDGNYLEYMGYDIFFDARPEIFSAAINHVRDIGQDFLDISRYEEGADALIGEYDFDYMIVGKNTALYMYLNYSDGFIQKRSSNELVLFAKVE